MANNKRLIFKPILCNCSNFLHLSILNTGLDHQISGTCIKLKAQSVPSQTLKVALKQYQKQHQHRFRVHTFINCIFKVEKRKEKKKKKRMIGRVLLELHKLDACIPVMRVVISKPDHQDIFYVIILSFNRSLTLQMTGFTMNCNPNRAEVFNFRDDVGCKRSTIFALKDCLSTKKGKDIHELCCNFCRTFAFDWSQNTELREMALIHFTTIRL